VIERRQRSSMDSERGATAVLIAIALVALLGMLSLTADGGLLFLKFRGMRNANDAAALAAAQSCGKDEGQGAADSQANLLATSNVADAIPTQAAVYSPSCDAPAGNVTVFYEGQQPLFLSQVIGVDSPKTVRAQATASWGGAGAAVNVLPLMLSLNRLSSCNIPDSVSIGQHCFFWWDNGNAQDQTQLTNAEWGTIDLNNWGVLPAASCPGNVSQADMTNWITNGFPGTLALNDPPPTYACRGAGFQGNALNNDIRSIAGTVVPMPVNDPQQQVQSDGTLCRPNGVDGTCTVHKYAIVGFAILEIVWVWTGNDAQTMCGQTSQNNGSIRCLEAIWRGYQTGGLEPGGGQNLGLLGVTLTG
jgi:Flp pilus assembly protein TadG